MVTTEDLKAYSNPKVHSEIDKLSDMQRQRIKNFIDEIIQKTKRGFEISELKIASDKIEISVNYELTMLE